MTCIIAANLLTQVAGDGACFDNSSSVLQWDCGGGGGGSRTTNNDSAARDAYRSAQRPPGDAVVVFESLRLIDRHHM